MKTITLKTSKKLQKVAEDLPESEFSWFIANGENHQKTELRKSNSGKFGLYEEYPAYTVGELLEILPKGLRIMKGKEYDNDKYEAEFIGDKTGQMLDSYNNNPAEALSRLLIKVIEEGIYETRE